MTGAFAVSPTGAFIATPTGAREMAPLRRAFGVTYIDETDNGYFNVMLPPDHQTNIYLRTRYEEDLQEYRNLRRPADDWYVALGLIQLRNYDGNWVPMLPPGAEFPEGIIHRQIERNPSSAILWDTYQTILTAFGSPSTEPSDIMPAYHHVDESGSMTRDDVAPGLPELLEFHGEYIETVAYYTLGNYGERWLKWMTFVLIAIHAG